jgi:hypothetical protein
MANVDQLQGFYPIRHLTGGEIRTNTYFVTTSAAIFKGDLVSAINTGCVSASTANDGYIVVGVAAEYVPAATSATAYTPIQVYDDPMIVYGIQCDSGTAPAVTDIFACANHVATTGNTTTGLSKHELDASDIGTGLQLRILRKVSDPNNAWGEHVDVEVLLNECLFSGSCASGANVGAATI